MLHFLSPPPAYFAERLRVVLRESFTQAEKLGTFEVGPISWRDYYGVFENLPFHQGDAPNYFEASDGLRLVSDEIWPVAAPEAQFTEGYDRGPVLFTPAFTVFHEGTAAHLLYTGFPSNAELRSIDLLYQGHAYTVWLAELLDGEAVRILEIASR